MAQKVIYTVLTGGYDHLQQPEVIDPDWDFVCFGDQDGQDLKGVVPDDGVMIHDHNRVLLVIDQGIADSLHIDTIRANLIICMHDAIDRIGVEVIGENLERIGMHEE